MHCVKRRTKMASRFTLPRSTGAKSDSDQNWRSRGDASNNKPVQKEQQRTPCVPVDEKTETYEVKINLYDSEKFFKATKEQHELLRYSNQSIYSITPWDQAEYTASLLMMFYTKDELKQKVITDASACIGGNTWAFAEMTRHCIAVELNPLHSEMLKHNMKVLGFDKYITVYPETNYLDVKDTLKQDIVFLDPPWGGLNYCNKNQVPTLVYTSSQGTPVTLRELVCTGVLAYQDLIMVKLPFNAPDDILKGNNYPHYQKIPIVDNDDRVIYDIHILSKIKPKYKISAKKFNRIKVRSIVAERV